MNEHLKAFGIFAAYYLVLKVVVAPMANPILAKVSPSDASGHPVVQL